MSPINTVKDPQVPGVYFKVTAKRERGQVQIMKEVMWLHKNYLRAKGEEKAKWAKKIRNFTRAHKHQIKVLIVAPGGKKEEISLEEFQDIALRGWRG